jgi:hypothetical protein
MGKKNQGQANTAFFATAPKTYRKVLKPDNAKK